MEKNMMEIRLSLHDIQEEIDRYNYYVGNSRREAGIPIKLAATLHTSADDKKQIESHMATAIGEIVQMMNRYFSDTRQTTGEDENNDGYRIVILTYRPSHNLPKETNRLLKELFVRYTVMRSVQLWMQQVKPDESVIAATEAEKIALQIHQAMTARIKPRNKRKRPDTRVEI